MSWPGSASPSASPTPRTSPWTIRGGVLLTQVQGVIAEYERAKIAERYRRGKLFRARAGEITTWRTAYGFRRVARSAATGPSHWEIYEPEAAVVRRIFTDRASGLTVREICRRLNTDRVPSPSGKATWGHSTLCRLLRNEAYIGRVYFNRTETVPDRRPTRRTRQVPRARDEWIPIECPRIVTDETFEAAGRVSIDNSKWSPRRAEPGEWLLRGLVGCGTCGVGTNCHKMQGRNGTWHRYYYCRNHDPIRAGGEDRRCPERNIRADALDQFVFDQIRTVLIHPDLLVAGEQAVAVSTPIPDDELLTAELARLDRKIDAAEAERRRLVDIYQAGLVELPDLQRRAAEVAARLQDLRAKQANLADQRTELARATSFAAESTTSPAAYAASSTNSTTFRNNASSGYSSRKFVSRAGTSRSDCASHSTHPSRANQQVTARPRRRHCQPMTVCVPLVASTSA